MGCIVSTQDKDSDLKNRRRMKIQKSISKFSKKNLNIDANSYNDIKSLRSRSTNLTLSNNNNSSKRSIQSQSILNQIVNTQQRQYGCRKNFKVIPEQSLNNVLFYKNSDKNEKNKVLKNQIQNNFSLEDNDQYTGDNINQMIEFRKQKKGDSIRRLSMEVGKEQQNQFGIDLQKIKRRNSQQYTQFHLKKQIKKQIQQREYRKYSTENYRNQQEQNILRKINSQQCIQMGNSYQDKVYSFISKREMKFNQFSYLKTTLFKKRVEKGCQIEPFAQLI